jgi:arginyl-tRNA--protein-N-Asp/Glu arginylyltransferase
MTESAGIEKRNHRNEKLTRVLSTKLSIEDYNRFQKYTNDAYRAGTISKPSVSEFLRYIVTYPFNELGL